ncbi:unnamed protein product [Tuwongella immobilis]|uniref:Uncharacterized protein n=2 Tax=Tuwongella immobilis TaxID=692036 RepID=A0A6C2YTQ4_9BACT|nr:unnamed protein product [Tuwongella immobilis]VTS07592.1 unnamed protein product [Tuwongella immobilis]
MAWSGNYEALRQYLRDFTNIGGDPAYDTHGILMLLLALADNLRASPAAVADLPELAETITPEHAAFLEKLSRWAAEARHTEPGDAAV